MSISALCLTALGKFFKLSGPGVLPLAADAFNSLCVSHMACERKASSSPQSQYPPPPDEDMRYLCFLCSEALKQSAHMTQVASWPQSRQL
jgi:hypothetical protein